MEREKQLFYGFAFVHCYGKQKNLRIVGEKRYSGKPYDVRLIKVPNEATLQAVG